MTLIHFITDQDCVQMFARRFADVILARANADTLKVITDYHSYVTQHGYNSKKFIRYITAAVPLVSVPTWTNAVFDLEHYYYVENPREKLANAVAELVSKGYEYGWSGDTEKLSWQGVDSDPADDDMLDLRDLHNEAQNDR